MAMGVLYGLSGPSNVDMSARAYRYGYCRCAWQSWCWQHNRDCWACAFAWSDGFAKGVLAARAAEARVQELYAKWEAELNQAEAAAAAAAAQEELREARAGKKKAKNKSKAGSSGGGQAEKKHVFKFRRVGGR